MWRPPKKSQNPPKTAQNGHFWAVLGSLWDFLGGCHIRWDFLAWVSFNSPRPPPTQKIGAYVWSIFGPYLTLFCIRGAIKKKTTKLWTSSKQAGRGVSDAAKPFIKKRHGHVLRGKGR